MELTIKVTPEDVNDIYTRADIVGTMLHCRECNRIVVDLGNNPPFAQIILKLAMHKHGVETR